MIATLLRLAGLDTKLAEMKRSLQQQADAAIAQAKDVALHLALSAGFVFAAMVFLLLAVMVGFIALYVWADNEWGTYQALALVGGVLIVLAVVSLVVGLRAARPRPKVAEAANPPFAAAAAEAAAAPTRLFARPDPISTDRSHIEPFIYILGRYARMPKSGYGMVDDLISSLAPRAEVAANDVIQRASGMIRQGDRKTMLAILGATAAMGWLIVRTSARNPASDKT